MSESGTPRSLFWASGLLTALALVPLVAWFDAPVHRPQDEGLLLVYPELILRGLLPHRDFLATYPPGNFFALAAIYALFEPSVVVERAVGLLYRVALVGGVFAIAASRGPAVAAAAGSSAALLLLPLRLEATSWIGAVSALTWSSWALLHGRVRTAGFLLGLSLTFRLDLLPGALALAASSAWLSDVRSKGSYGTPETIKQIAQGASLLLLPLILYFVLISPHNAIRDLILDPVFLSGPARRLPLESLGTTALRLLLLLVLALLLHLATCWREREFRRRDRRPGVLLAVLCVGLLPQSLQRMDADHLLYVLVVVGALIPVSLDRLSEGRFQRSTALLVSFGLLGTAAGGPLSSLMRAAIADEGAFKTPGRIHRNDRDLPARNRHELFAFAKLGTQLDHSALPGDRLFIGPEDLSQTTYSDLHLYSLFPELIPASYYVEMNPRSANRLGTRLTTDLETADWVLLSSEWNQWDEANPSAIPGDSRPNAILRRRFRQVGEAGFWSLYRRKSNSNPSSSEMD